MIGRRLRAAVCLTCHQLCYLMSLHAQDEDPRVSEQQQPQDSGQGADSPAGRYESQGRPPSELQPAALPATPAGPKQVCSRFWYISSNTTPAFSCNGHLCARQLCRPACTGTQSRTPVYLAFLLYLRTCLNRFVFSKWSCCFVETGTATASPTRLFNPLHSLALGTQLPDSMLCLFDLLGLCV